MSKLKKLLQSINATMEKLTCHLSFAIYDKDGSTLFGRGEDGERFALIIENEEVGFIQASPDVRELLQAVLFLAEEKRALADETLEKYKELSLVYRLFEKLSNVSEVDEIARVCKDEVLRLLNPCYFVFKYHSQIIDSFGKETFNDSQFAIFESQINQTAEVLNDAAEDARFQQLDPQLKSIICAPLMAKDTLFGLITVAAKRSAKSFSAGDLKIMQALAKAASSCLENVQLSKEKIENERIRANLSRYLAPQIVDAITASSAKNAFSLEKRSLSVLFSDIRNFSTLCNKIYPEKLVSHLNEYFTYLVDVIFNSSATLDKYTGDGLIALFNAPQDLANHEIKAIQTAINMQKCISQIPSDWIREYFKTGIGISTGDAIVGNIGTPTRTDYTAIGDTVNLAQRLQAMALGDQILVSNNLYERTKNHFTFRMINEVLLKGQSKPMKVYEVVY